MEVLTVEEKKRFLKTLEEDEEFRLAVAAKLGLLEILNELRKLREDFNKLYQKSLEHDKRFEAIERKLLEHDEKFNAIDRRFESIEKKLLEHGKRLEAIEKKLEEHDKRFEAIERKLLEHDKCFEAIERKLLEHDKRFEAIERKLLDHDKRFEAIEKELVLHRKLIEYNRRDIGALTEATISRFVYEDIKEIVKESGEKILKRRRNARIDGYDIDLLIETDKKVYVVEIKIQPSHSDVDSLVEKAKVVENAMKKPVKAILAGIWIGVEVEIESYASSRGIEVFEY